jgi:hypothetical protein
MLLVRRGRLRLSVGVVLRTGCARRCITLEVTESRVARFRALRIPIRVIVGRSMLLVRRGRLRLSVGVVLRTGCTCRCITLAMAEGRVAWFRALGLSIRAVVFRRI